MLSYQFDQLIYIRNKNCKKFFYVCNLCHEICLLQASFSNVSDTYLLITHYCFRHQFKSKGRGTLNNYHLRIQDIVNVTSQRLNPLPKHCVDIFAAGSTDAW